MDTVHALYENKNEETEKITEACQKPPESALGQTAEVRVCTHTEDPKSDFSDPIFPQPPPPILAPRTKLMESKTASRQEWAEELKGGRKGWESAARTTQ